MSMTVNQLLITTPCGVPPQGGCRVCLHWFAHKQSWIESLDPVPERADAGQSSPHSVNEPANDGALKRWTALLRLRNPSRWRPSSPRTRLSAQGVRLD